MAGRMTVNEAITKVHAHLGGIPKAPVTSLKPYVRSANAANGFRQEKMTGALSITEHQTEKEGRLLEIFDKAMDLEKPYDAINLARQLESTGIIADKNAPKTSYRRILADQHANIETALTNLNRPAEGKITFLPPTGFFTLTDKTPSPEKGYSWNKQQILIRDYQELLDLISEGALVMKGNSKVDGLSTVAQLFANAGAASRAFDFAKSHPDLVKTLNSLWAESISNGAQLELLKHGEIPPRYLYPVSHGLERPKSLLEMVMGNNIRVGNKLGLVSMFVSMMSAKSSAMTLNSLQPFLSKLSDEQLDLSLAYNQPVARRRYVSDRTLTETLDPTGHGDLAYLTAKYELYKMMKDVGIEVLTYFNADEYMFGWDPLRLGVFRKLQKIGFDAVVYVVPNSNDQKGGGATIDATGADSFIDVNEFKQYYSPAALYDHIYSKGYTAHLEEGPCLPASLMAKSNPAAINTTFHDISMDALVSATSTLSQLHPALDIKKTKGRLSPTEQCGALETWAGTEFGRALAINGKRIAFVFAPRAGFFGGFKTLEHSHSDLIPPELNDHPVVSLKGLTYRQLHEYMAGRLPSIMDGILSGSPEIAKKLYDSGCSYLIEV